MKLTSSKCRLPSPESKPRPRRTQCLWGNQWLWGATLILSLILAAKPGAQASESGRTIDLISALSSDQLEVQRLALWSLKDRELTSESFPAVLQLLESRDALTQRYAQETLEHQGAAAIPALLQHLQQQPRSRATEQLLATLAPESIAGLIELGTSSSPLAARRGALRTLAQIGPQAADQATHPLLQALRLAPHRTERTFLADTLGSLGSAALPQLLNASQVHPELGEYVSIAIARMESQTEDALDFLISSLTSSQSRQRFSAARALGNIGPKADASLPALKHALVHDSNTSVRLYSAEALGRIAPTRPEIREVLLQALPDADAPVATKLIGALAAGGPSAIPELELQLESSSATTRARVVAVLREIEGAPAKRVEILLEQLDDPSESVRDAAALALRYVGGQAKAPFVAGLKDPRPRVRAYVTLVCGQIEPALATAVPSLIQGLQDPELKVRQMSAWALGKFGPLASSGAADLVEALKSPDDLLRRNAAWALGTLGVSDVAPQLERLLTDPSADVASEAEEALAKLRGTYEKVEEGE